MLRSPDGGATWQLEEHNVGFPQYEPATLFHNDTFLFVTRDESKHLSHTQMSWRPGEKLLSASHERSIAEANFG